MKLLVAVLALAVGCAAQSNSGTLSGTIAAATKIKVLQDNREVMTGVADGHGNFSFKLPAGDYLIQAGNLTERVTISSGKSITVDLAQPDFFDEPQFTVAGVTDNTYRGGHGSDNVLRSSETLAKATASLGDASHSQAEMEEAAGNSLQAVRDFQKAAEANPTERNVFDWGTELLSHKAAEAAAEVFTKGTKLFPQSSRMLLGLATSWYAAGSYQKAARCFFEAIDLNSDDPHPYAFLIQTQPGEITQSTEYQERFARFAKAHPDNASANYYYAVSLCRQHGDMQEARRRLDRALKLNPHLADAWLQLGILNAMQNRYAEAIAALQRAVAEEPEMEEAHYRLSEAYRVTGNRAKAQEELQTFQRLSKTSGEERERERRKVQQFVIALKETAAKKK